LLVLIEPCHDLRRHERFDLRIGVRTVHVLEHEGPKEGCAPVSVAVWGRYTFHFKCALYSVQEPPFARREEE
jgi:hypothetical protein